MPGLPLRYADLNTCLSRTRCLVSLICRLYISPFRVAFQPFTSTRSTYVLLLLPAHPIYHPKKSLCSPPLAP